MIPANTVHSASGSSLSDSAEAAASQGGEALSPRARRLLLQQDSSGSNAVADERRAVGEAQAVTGAVFAEATRISSGGTSVAAGAQAATPSSIADSNVRNASDERPRPNLFDVLYVVNETSVRTNQLPSEDVLAVSQSIGRGDIDGVAFASRNSIETTNRIIEKLVHGGAFDEMEGYSSAEMVFLKELATELFISSKKSSIVCDGAEIEPFVVNNIFDHRLQTVSDNVDGLRSRFELAKLKINAERLRATLEEEALAGRLNGGSPEAIEAVSQDIRDYFKLDESALDERGWLRPLRSDLISFSLSRDNPKVFQTSFPAAQLQLMMASSQILRTFDDYNQSVEAGSVLQVNKYDKAATVFLDLMNKIHELDPETPRPDAALFLAYSAIEEKRSPEGQVLERDYVYHSISPPPHTVADTVTTRPVGNGNPGQHPFIVLDFPRVGDEPKVARDVFDFGTNINISDVQGIGLRRGEEQQGYKSLVIDPIYNRAIPGDRFPEYLHSNQELYGDFTAFDYMILSLGNENFDPESPYGEAHQNLPRLNRQPYGSSDEVWSEQFSLTNINEDELNTFMRDHTAPRDPETGAKNIAENWWDKLSQS